METVYLHGFATTPAIWGRQPLARGPQLEFVDLDQTASQVAAGLTGETILVGWSMGGMVALKVAAAVPEKVRKLVLISTTPKFLQSEDWPYGVAPALLRRLEQKIEREGIGAFHDLIFTDIERVGLADLSIAQAKKELAELARVDLRGLLAKISQPTLIVQGDKDEITLPEAGEYLRQNIPESRLEVFAGAGHAPFLEKSERFNLLLQEFISNVR